MTAVLHRALGARVARWRAAGYAADAYPAVAYPTVAESSVAGWARSASASRPVSTPGYRAPRLQSA